MNIMTCQINLVIQYELSTPITLSRAVHDIHTKVHTTFLHTDINIITLNITKLKITLLDYYCFILFICKYAVVNGMTIFTWFIRPKRTLS